MYESCSDTLIFTVHANYHSKGLVTNALTSGLVSVCDDNKVRRHVTNLGVIFD